MKLNSTMNKRLFFGGIFISAFSIIFFANKVDILGYVLISLGLIMYLLSRIFFLLRESFSIFKSKAYLWTIIPTYINLVLLSMMMGEFSNNDDSDTGLYLAFTILFIGFFTMVRKVLLKERLFWY